MLQEGRHDQTTFVSLQLWFLWSYIALSCFSFWRAAFTTKTMYVDRYCTTITAVFALSSPVFLQICLSNWCKVLHFFSAGPHTVSCIIFKQLKLSIIICFLLFSVRHFGLELYTTSVAVTPGLLDPAIMNIWRNSATRKPSRRTLCHKRL